MLSTRYTNITSVTPEPPRRVLFSVDSHLDFCPFLFCVSSLLSSHALSHAACYFFPFIPSLSLITQIAKAGWGQGQALQSTVRRLWELSHAMDTLQYSIILYNILCRESTEPKYFVGLYLLSLTSVGLLCSLTLFTGPRKKLKRLVKHLH